MIKLDFSVAVSLYLLLSVVGLLTIWVSFSYMGRERLSSGQKGLIWYCSICTHIYIDSLNEVLSICPRCGSYNKRRVEKK